MQEKHQITWPLWRKITFRFLFIYFALAIFSGLMPFLGFMSPVLAFIGRIYTAVNNPVVTFFNKHILHIKETLVPPLGSGDTSFGWAQLYTYILIAFIGSIIWSLFDSKRPNYLTLDFWLRNSVRYFVSAVAFIYGIIKLFALQMPFPNLSQLATPLGDFYPMRFSWMFMGYSASYQIFSGVMETLVGLLLLNRKTVTTGVLLGIGVFANVVLLNLSYDIPVKIFSMQILFACIYLALCDWRRIANFFILNKPVEADSAYQITLNNKWQKWGRIAAKSLFIFVFVIMGFYQSWNRYQRVASRAEVPPIKSGIYDVQTYVLNNDTLPPLTTDSLHWKNIVFDKGGSGSVNSKDPMFRQRYGRGYFSYQTDTIAQTLSIKRFLADSTDLFTFKYELPNSENIILRSENRGDTIYIHLNKREGAFPLSKKEFNWMTEAIK